MIVYRNGEHVEVPDVVFEKPISNITVTSRQIRQALTQTGDRTAVESAVAAGTQDLKDWWEFATTFERLHPEVIAMGTMLGKTDVELDALFQLAITL